MNKSEVRIEIEAVAAELDAIADREESALEVIQGKGIEVNKYSLNYPSEQRELARRVRALGLLSPRDDTLDQSDAMFRSGVADGMERAALHAERAVTPGAAATRIRQLAARLGLETGKPAYEGDPTDPVDAGRLTPFLTFSEPVKVSDIEREKALAIEQRDAYRLEVDTDVEPLRRRIADLEERLLELDPER